jgi:TonB family protein
MPSTTRLTRSVCATALVSCLLGAGASAQQAAAPANASSCASADACIDGILAATGPGRELERMAQARRLRFVPGNRPGPAARRPARPLPETTALGNVDLLLTSVLRDASADAPSLPGYRRALALAYLKTNQLTQAERELRDGITSMPTHAAFWTDLALVFNAQGKREQAVAALVVADDWSGSPEALRKAYGEAAAAGPMAAAYKEALQAIAANGAALERLDAELTARAGVPASGPADKNTPTALADFKRCQMPEYPRSSLRNEETGKVTLQFFTDADGKVLRARKTASSGHIDLDNASLLALSGCPFQPAVIKGKPVPGWSAVQYVWQLD